MHIVLDETAMAAAGQGNILASRLIHRAHAEPGWFLYAPTCALVEADRARPGTAEHLAALPGITVLDLDLPAALALAAQETWAAAHSQYAAQPTPDRPDGAIIATTIPKRWDGRPVRVLDLNA
ncbi:hypothetical protein OIE62_41590 (plasmid) [Streptomyces scopuliridis]|uniref:Uncharacterized protein n=1 Tax=Streptomyces scopuliridis TaxID=452529 RepID=A0ACD4ZYK7_9ACTN|nr:hypothetical protein [Streptomyces scopuliridis]WSB39321.1 hypothetical protein OG949_41470 [Streptomyces scopuliridis]WSC03570.1 hypothetical protein OG835_41900 [Streptomyces scopuliridis]WSC11421.1 hypothetical protein OIE62_41590 [Streptomyces scopuliridis]